MDDQTYQTMLETVGSIVAIGAWVNHLAGYKRLKASNVQSVAALIELATDPAAPRKVLLGLSAVLFT